MSIADRVRVSSVEEVTYGVTPSSNLQDMRITSLDLHPIQQLVSSAEIRSDRQVTDLIRADWNVEGPIDFELSYGTFDLWFEAVFMSADWTSATALVAVDANVDIVFTAATGNIQATGKFASANQYQWIQLTNLTGDLAAMNNKCYKILTVTDNDNIIVAGAEAIVSGTQSASLTDNGMITMGAQIVNGTEHRSFSLEANYADLTTEYRIWKGLMFDRLSLSTGAGSKATGNFQLLGKSEDRGSSSAGSGYTAANSNPIMNCIQHVTALIEGTPAVNTDNRFEAVNFDLEVANNLRMRKIIGTLGPDSIGAGKSEWSGRLNAYFEGQSAVDKFHDFTTTALAMTFLDSATNAYVLDLPAVKLEAGPTPVEGENTDVMVPFTWRGFRNSDEDITARLVRFPAA